MKRIDELIQSLELKAMEGSLLTLAVKSAVAEITDSSKDIQDVHDAISMASYLHRNDTRANRGNLPRDAYITHPLRNTLRLIRYGVTNIDILIASILHDTVEDHAMDIAKDFAGVESKISEEAAYELAFIYIDSEFNSEVTRIVRAMSNPLKPEGLSKDEKRAVYAKHVKEVIQDPDVFLTKFSDFVDNAVGLRHNTGSPQMMAHLAIKYSLVAEAFAELLNDSKFTSKLAASHEGIASMKVHISEGMKHLSTLISK